MRIDKHNASLILAGVVVVLFSVFIVVAGFLYPGANTDTIVNEDARALAESMSRMIWWMTVAVIILPIMLVVIVVAAYLFITEDRVSRTRPSRADKNAEKVKEATDPHDALDLRYARGELSRDQYMAMKADMGIRT
jgi:uncharacterized membrane protein